jgi:TPP-dependent pyruvate/acetoin dehydrogenase alpha subunit
VWDAFGGFLDSARSGRGPFLLECLTQRLRGHYEGDPGSYREAIAADDWQEKDPILRLQRHGVAHGWFGGDEPAAIEAGAAEAVETAVRFARESPFPPAGLIGELVYADG